MHIFICLLLGIFRHFVPNLWQKEFAVTLKRKEQLKIRFANKISSNKLNYVIPIFDEWSLSQVANKYIPMRQKITTSRICLF